MSYRVVRNDDGSLCLFVDGQLDLTADEDAVDARLWELYGSTNSSPQSRPE